MSHIPVLLDEVLEFFNLDNGDVIVDATFGMGGHSKEILKRIGKDGKLIGFEKDERTFGVVNSRRENVENLVLINDSYENILECLEKINVKKINGILFDLGVSSMQIDEEARGFSYRFDCPLDMRFSIKQKITARDIVNLYKENEIADIIYRYGEERSSRRIAREIVHSRKSKAIETTFELKEIIRKCVHKREHFLDTVTRVFQAIRIAVNDELGTIKRTLENILPILDKDARILVISFHSLEDRIVKDFFRRESTDCLCDKNIFVCECGHKASLKIITKKPITATYEEIKNNPRSRSAKLRVAEKL